MVLAVQEATGGLLADAAHADRVLRGEDVAPVLLPVLGITLAAFTALMLVLKM
ncbi:hypothetical protein [Streptomyces tauricus]|uniref:hypothetical protein n=1 Tax=Streptomyces tauricus TaxID=68274 RepID=UPI002243C5A9|nr:hypothetical protein [Streptomyces tauricus]MCW8102696.1 hypothetical protein [Streptomyces tauricus]